MREAVVAALLLAGGASLVAVTRPGLAAVAHRVKQRDDVYTLPPPGELRLLSLGYDAALVDTLWAKLLVEYGTHWGEHRAFEDVPHYLDAILALEPDYPPLYKYAATLLVYRPLVGTEADARMARAYLERGVFKERPDDHAVWLEYGQFIGFIGPGFLPSPAEQDEWRHDGAKAIAHAVELGADPDRSLTAATMLSRYGERDAALKELERALPLTDDPYTQAQIELKLQLLRETVTLGDFLTKDQITVALSLYPDATAIRERLVDPGLAEINAKLGHDADPSFLTSVILFAVERAREDQEKVARVTKTIDAARRRSLPFLSRGEFLLVTPEVDAARCAGRDASREAACARSWDARLR